MGKPNYFQVWRGMRIIGAIGVSGGTVSQNTKVAEAGVETFENS